MATDSPRPPRPAELAGLLRDLASADWSTRAEAVIGMGALLRGGAAPESAEAIARAFTAAAEDKKWEVRAGVARESLWLRHPVFELERVLGTLARDADQRVAGAARAVLRRRRVEAEAGRPRSGRRRREALARAVKHDVGTLEAAQRTGLQALMRELDAEGLLTVTRREALENLLLRAQRMNEVVKINLDLSRAARPRLRQELLRPLVVAAIGDAQGARPDQARSVEFRVEVPVRLSVDTHGGLLVNALTNVLVNALEAFDGASGTIRIGARAEGDDVILEVQDDGPGMTPRMLESLGCPGRSTKRVPGGAIRGYGFASVIKAVEDCRGQVVPESEPGRGTRIKFTLPAPERREES